MVVDSTVTGREREEEEERKEKEVKIERKVGGEAQVPPAAGTAEVKGHGDTMVAKAVPPPSPSPTTNPTPPNLASPHCRVL